MVSFEFERRFLVDKKTIVDGHEGNLIIQAYLFVSDGYVVRVRRTHIPTGMDGEAYREASAMLATKGPRREGAREEYEMEIPPSHASELIRRASWKVSKSRYQIVENDCPWDVDIFHGDNEGLIIAECEGSGLALVRIPSWCGREVTGDRRYDNESLAQSPFLHWPRGGQHL